MHSAARTDELTRVIVLVRGKMDVEGNYWCYVTVKPSRYEAFLDASKSGYNIQNFVSDGYGEIVVSGTGESPDNDITAQVAELFGTTPDKLFSGENPLVAIDRLLQN